MHINSCHGIVTQQKARFVFVANHLFLNPLTDRDEFSARCERERKREREGITYFFSFYFPCFFLFFIIFFLPATNIFYVRGSLHPTPSLRNGSH